MSHFENYSIAFTPAKNPKEIDGSICKFLEEKTDDDIIPRAPIKKFGSPSPLNHHRRKQKIPHVINEFKMTSLANVTPSEPAVVSMPLISGANVIVDSPDPMSKYNNNCMDKKRSLMPTKELISIPTTPISGSNNANSRDCCIPLIGGSNVTMDSPDPLSKYASEAKRAIIFPSNESKSANCKGITTKNGSSMPDIYESNIEIDSPDPMSKYSNYNHNSEAKSTPRRQTITPSTEFKCVAFPKTPRDDHRDTSMPLIRGSNVCVTSPDPLSKYNSEAKRSIIPKSPLISKLRKPIDESPRSETNSHSSHFNTTFVSESKTTVSEDDYRRGSTVRRYSAKESNPDPESPRVLNPAPPKDMGSSRRFVASRPSAPITPNESRPHTVASFQRRNYSSSSKLSMNNTPSDDTALLPSLQNYSPDTITAIDDEDFSHIKITPRKPVRKPLRAIQMVEAIREEVLSPNGDNFRESVTVLADKDQRSVSNFGMYGKENSSAARFGFDSDCESPLISSSVAAPPQLKRPDMPSFSSIRRHALIR